MPKWLNMPPESWDYMSMTKCKYLQYVSNGDTAVSPLLTYWRYCCLALNHWDFLAYGSTNDFFIEFCFLGCNWWHKIIGLHNGLALNRQQAIIWTNDDPVQWSIYAMLGRDELKGIFQVKIKHLKKLGGNSQQILCKQNTNIFLHYAYRTQLRHN